MITLLVALYLSPVCVNIPAVGVNDGREKHVSSRIKLYEAEPPPSLGCQRETPAKNTLAGGRNPSRILLSALPVKANGRPFDMRPEATGSTGIGYCQRDRSGAGYAALSPDKGYRPEQFPGIPVRAATVAIKAQQPLRAAGRVNRYPSLT